MDSPDVPDYSQQINKQNDITDRQIALSEKAYADQKAMVDKFLPMFQQQAQLNIDQQAQTNARADSMWKSYMDTFQPLEKSFAETAANYDTQGRRDQAAADAAAGVAQQFDVADQTRAEQLAASGADPQMGLALSNASGIEKAKAIAGAQNQARKEVEATGLSLKNAAIGIGRGQVSDGLQAADLALRQGGAGLGAAGGGTTLAAQPYATGSGILGGATSSNLATTNIMNTGYNNALAGSQAQMGFLSDIIGAGATAWGMRSSEKAKDMKGKVSDGEALSLLDASPSKRWSYKQGEGDGNTKERIGPTAESLKGTPVSDGETIDAISMLGLHHAGLRAVNKKIDKLADQVGRLTKQEPANDKSARHLSLASAKRGA